MPHFRRFLMVGTIGFILGAGAALGQVITAAVHGTVTDQTNAVVSGATVTATNTSTGIATTVETNHSGNYVFPQLQIGGPYTIEITKAGFQKFQSTGLRLLVNDNREIDARLKVGSTSQTVQVGAAATGVETVETQLRQVITAKQIETAPLLRRDASGLQKLAPGSVESSDAFGTYATNGNQTQSNSYLLDGVDNNDTPLQTSGIIINPDALAEQDIITSTINPEFARNSGAIINQVLKSGTNQFHGSGFWFYRDTFMNNGDYFSQTRPKYHQNLFGGTLGGPVIKNRLFFFSAYQGTRNGHGTTQNSPVLSDAQRNGVFTGDSIPGAEDSQHVFLSDNPMPFAVGSCAAGTPWSTCFPGTNPSVVISPSDFNPVSANLVEKFVPQANENIGGAVYNFNAPNSQVADQGVLRADFHLSEHDSLWGSTVFESNPSTEALSFYGSDLPGFGETASRHFKVFSAAWTHTFNSTTLNELRAGYYRFNYASVEPEQILNPASFGFNITPQSSSMNLPTISVTGLDGTSSFLGFSPYGPQPRKDTNLVGADNFTKIVGNHSLKFGVLWEKFATSNPYFANNNGSYTFSGAGGYSSGDPILDFMLGIPDEFVQTSGGFIDNTGNEYYAYAQDSWRATHDLTLNYGIAWDVETPYLNHQFGGIGVTCWSPGNETSNVLTGGPPGLTYPGDPGCNKAGGPKVKWAHFGPRFGFAWSPSNGPAKLIGTPGDHKFVLRGGFGLYYNRDSMEGELQNLGDPPFFMQTLGAADVGGNPGFADPFSDVTGSGGITNPFPFVRPTPGTAIDFEPLGPFQLSSLSRSYAVPYIYNFNLNIQRSLPSDMILQVGYVGSIGKRLPRAYEQDKVTAAGHAGCLADPFCASHPALLSLFSPQYKTQPAMMSSGYPWYLSVGTLYTDGISSYHSLQASMTKRTTHGLTFTLAYTYSHAMDNASGLESSGFNGLGVNTFPGFEYLSYGDSDYDARNRLVATYIYELPIFPSWRTNLFAREALGGWHLSGMTALQNGFPVTVTSDGIYNSLYCDQFTFYSCPDNPNTSTFRIKSLNPRAEGHAWFDGSVFSPEPLGTFGNAKRNFFHGPGYNYTNMSLYKDFPMGNEGRYIQVRLESFNTFNHANFDLPNANSTDGTHFGVISSVKHSVDANSDPTPGRDIQLAARFVF